jgi:nucleoside-diphosphate-sugar epimerase
MQDIAGKRVEIEYAPERLADVRHCRADISKIRAELGYEPTVGLEEGLRQYLEWFERDSCRLEP